jgi:hypothetical protein
MVAVVVGVGVLGYYLVLLVVVGGWVGEVVDGAMLGCHRCPERSEL